MFSRLVNWVTSLKNKIFRKVLEIVAGIDKRVQLPKYNSETFSNFFKKNKDKINLETPNKGRKVVIYTTCFVNFNKKNNRCCSFKSFKKEWCRSSRSLSWMLRNAIFGTSRFTKSCPTRQKRSLKNY